MWEGVSKSGSPISRWMISRPVASSALALARTENAVSVPSRSIRSASFIPAHLLSAQERGTHADGKEDQTEQEQAHGYQTLPEGVALELFLQLFLRAVADEEPALLSLLAGRPNLPVGLYRPKHIVFLVYLVDALDVTVAYSAFSFSFNDPPTTESDASCP